MSIRIHQLLLILLGFAILGGSTFAQDNRRRGNWDPSEYLQRIDENKNGQMDPGELKGRLADYVRNLGFTTDQPIPISDIVKRAKGDSPAKKETGSNNQTGTKTFTRKVPGFGVEQTSGSGVVPNFSPDGTISNPAMLRRQFGDAVMNEVERSMNRYDSNRDGVLDAQEIQKGRWGRPSPADSDANKDGRLTKSELASRYKQRQSGDIGGDRTSSTSRDRNSRDRGNRESESRDRNSRERESNSGGSASDARARAREAAAKAAKEREREKEGKEREKEREELQGSSARERARAAAARQLEARKRERESGSSSSSSRNDRSSRDTERYRNVANGMIRKYDKNGDKVLDAKELESYRTKPKDADADGDGKVTADELFEAYLAKSGSSSSSGGSSSSSRDRSSRGSSRSSSGQDRDGDGRIKMSEFADKWTQEKIDEFNQLDKNQDGYLSKDEFSKR